MKILLLPAKVIFPWHLSISSLAMHKRLVITNKFFEQVVEREMQYMPIIMKLAHVYNLLLSPLKHEPPCELEAQLLLHMYVCLKEKCSNLC